MYGSIASVAVILLSIVSTILPAGSSAQDVSASSGDATTATQSEQAGSVVLAVGIVTNTAADGDTHQLHDGDPIYSGDVISTGDDSYTDLDFEDGGRMLLRPNTDFQIQQYHYDPAVHGYALAPGQQPPQTAPSAVSRQAQEPQPQHESAFFRLIRGGFRAISGFIGHVEHQDYAVETPVATIGIRGTGYEVRYCTSDCGPGERGLFTGVGNGAIVLRNQAGESVTTAGHFGYLENRKGSFRQLTGPPLALQQMRLPARYRTRDTKNLQRIRMRRQYRWEQHPRHQHGLGHRGGYHLKSSSANIRYRRDAKTHLRAQARKKRKRIHHDGRGS
jgi:hypothetical protein